MKLLLLLPLLVLCSAVQGKEYTVYVKTANTPSFSGTDANVWIKIHGQNGVTGEKKLVNGRDAFEKGNMDTFKVEAKDVGFVNAVEVKRDDSGGFTNDWYLDSIQVAVNNGGNRYPPSVFNKWIEPNKWYKQNGNGGRGK